MSLRLNCFGISTKVFAFLCLGIFLLGASSAWGQTSTAGTVAGLVTDEQSAAIPGATVKLTDTSTNEVHTSVSNIDGRYAFTSVPPGKYNLSFGKEIGRASCRERV